MNTKQQFLAWVRTQHPDLYWKSLRATFSPKSGLGGLGDDLLSSVGIDAATANVSSDTTDAINAAASAAASPDSSTQGGGTDFWSALVNGIKNLAPTVLQTQQSQQLVKLNAQNAARGLPLYDTQGHVIPNSATSPASAAIAQMEAALAGSSGLAIPLLGIGALALFLLARRGRN